MVFVQTKNLIVNLWLFIVAVITLVSNFNFVSLAVTAVFMIVIFLNTVITNKDDGRGIIENSVVYLSFTFLLLYFLYKRIDIITFDFERTFEALVNSVLANILFLILGIVLFIILYKVGSGSKNKILKCCLQHLALVIMLLGVNQAVTGASSIGLLLIILSVFSLVCTIFEVSKSTEPKKGSKSLFWLMTASLIVILSEGIFKSESLFSYNLNLVMNDLLRWYVVLAISVVAWICTGYIFGVCLEDENTQEKDCYLLAGFAGFIPLLKSIVYYSYPMSWILMVAYIIVTFFVIWGKINKDKKDAVDLGSGTIWTAMIGYGLSIANIMIYYGYFAVLMTLVIGIPATIYIGNNLKGWKGVFLKSASIVIVAALASIFASKHNYISDDYIVFIIASAIVAIFFVFAINFMSNKNRNTEDKAYSLIVAIVFSIMAFFSVFRSGTNIDVKLFKNGSNLSADAIIIVEADPQGKDNTITDMEYYWKDSFGFDSSEYEATPLPIRNTSEKQSFSIKAREGELVVVTVDSNGVKTQKNCYFSVH